MAFLTLEPKDPARFDIYGQLIGAMRALAKPDGLSFGFFGIGSEIAALEDVNNVLTVKYPSAAAMVEYSSLFVRAWKLIATPDVHRFVRHECPGAQGSIVVVGNPFANEAEIAWRGEQFRYSVFPSDDRARYQSLLMVIGAMKVPGYPAPLAAGSPLLLGRHIVRMSWESGIVAIEWASTDAFLAWGNIAMYAWRVSSNNPVAGTIRHVLPGSINVDVNLWELDPWEQKVNGYLKRAVVTYQPK
ncbi:hypothetical protein [Paraburkholderia sp. J8-2]|uniref:hypothetical protein n=1 Tax=Paraburkholderia sp. J8-2 TaxID=2805440 RepID=UPI002AB79D98|nr:hypothetical protein [Paraburkholderia sp. J8-2]